MEILVHVKGTATAEKNSSIYGILGIMQVISSLALVIVFPSYLFTGEKPFKCTFCEYATAQNSTLKIHLKRHHGRQGSSEKEGTSTTNQHGVTMEISQERSLDSNDDAKKNS